MQGISVTPSLFYQRRTSSRVARCVGEVCPVLYYCSNVLAALPICEQCPNERNCGSKGGATCWNLVGCILRCATGGPSTAKIEREIVIS